jgi:cytoskeleton protein RodZ
MAPEVGQTLRSARTSRGIELDDVEQATKIRVKYLQAMEDDRWDELPGAAYARGFLATYARYLDLDDQALVAEYKRLYEGDESAQPIPEEMLPERGQIRTSPIRPGMALLLGAVAAVALALVLVLTVFGGSDDGGDGRGRASAKKHPEESANRNTRAERSPAEPARSSVRLRSTGTVWVCLLDGTGDRLVNGETLSAGEERGPFEAYSFDVTFGNGGVEMEVDGKPVDIPDAAEPIGYEISEGSARELAASAQPTCS